jgi:DNA polymerase I-like protein with 3'-5' exonuclease and polymerase domains
LGRQESAYPSLNEAAQRYGLPLKHDKVAEYWAQGVQTSDIPREIVREYALHDAELHLQVYQKQQERIKPHQVKLLSLHMQDLLVLQDMEWNGMAIDEELSLKKAEEIETKVSAIKDRLVLHHNVPTFNWASNDHLSALLYGGTIEVDTRVPAGFFKSGKKVGEVRYKIETQTYHLPRHFKPLRGSETKKEGVYKVDEPTLLKLGKSDLLEGILEIGKLEKLAGTYYRGVPAFREKSYQPKGYVHPQFNQVVARTGRLSCVKPNLQNVPPEYDICFISRFR